MRRLEGDAATDGSASPLARLFHPLPLDAFFKNDWDRQSVFVAGPAGRYDPVMRLEDFERAIFDARLSSPNLRFLDKSIGGRAESLDHFLRKKVAWTEPRSADQLARELRKGTLVYVAIESAVPSVRAWCKSLFSDLRCQLSVNAYFSAGRDASAFDAHFDPQDTFILQLEGEKEWRLWERDRVLNPISGYPDQKTVAVPALPADETVLMTPGDLLYVPRGMWHWPRSLSDAPSLHLTLTVVMPRPVDVMTWLIAELSSEPEFRAALPLSPHQQGGSGLKAPINAVLTHISNKVTSPVASTMAMAYMLRDATRTVMRDDPETDDKDF